MILHHTLSFLTIACLLACPAQKESTIIENNNALNAVWYQGKAEINIYSLSQYQYGEIHPGQAIDIFVTEDFLTDRNVKNDTYTESNSSKVLKNNKIRRFTTGIYDYSIYTSVFNKEVGALEKITTSSQDWCGQSWMQVTNDNNTLNIAQRSYFEQEGDVDYNIPTIQTEDELFNTIRINPSKLPIGTSQMVVSTSVARLLHVPYKAYNISAKLSLTQQENGAPVGNYTVNFPELQRELSITYRDDSLRKIISWKDTYTTSEYSDQSTVATLEKSIWIDYWNNNSSNDIYLRDSLGISNF